MPTGRTLITAAVYAEVKPLVRRLRLRRDRAARQEPTWSGDGVTLLLTGMGRRAGPCVRAAMRTLTPARVFTVGVAGGLSPDLNIGDVIVPARVVCPIEREHTPTLPAESSGTLLTVEQLVDTVLAKRAIAASYDADAVDMESAHIAAACDEFGVPWLSVRTISDTVDHAVPLELASMVTDAGQPHVPSIAAWALGRPSRMALLMRLGRHTRRAADRLAGAVIERL